MNARVVRRARAASAAFSSVAFSRSSRPMRPSSCESVTAASGSSSRRIAAARVSHSALRGEKTEAMPTEVMPAARIRRAASRMPVSSKGTIGRPSYSWPPSSMTTSPRTRAARSSGQSTKGGSEALAGRPIRIAATRVRSRRCTTALVKCVVPIMTASIGPAGATPASKLAQRRRDPARHVGRGGRLDGVDDGGAVEQHGIGVGATDVDADDASERLRRAPALDGRAAGALHENTEVNSRS